MNLKIKSVQFQRNGISGEPFYAVWFSFKEEEKEYNLIATVTDTKGGSHVVDPNNPGSKWKGDNFEPELRQAIIRDYISNVSDKHGTKMTITQAKEELNDGLKERVY